MKVVEPCRPSQCSNSATLGSGAALDELELRIKLEELLSALELGIRLELDTTLELGAALELGA